VVDIEERIMCNTDTNSGRKSNKSWMRSGLLGIFGIRVAIQAESIGCAIVHESGITATFREYEHSGNRLNLHSLQPTIPFLLLKIPKILSFQYVLQTYHSPA
jgi:hypothetical protein